MTFMVYNESEQRAQWVQEGEVNMPLQYAAAGWMTLRLQLMYDFVTQLIIWF